MVAIDRSYNSNCHHGAERSPKIISHWHTYGHRRFHLQSFWCSCLILGTTGAHSVRKKNASSAVSRWFEVSRTRTVGLRRWFDSRANASLSSPLQYATAIKARTWRDRDYDRESAMKEWTRERWAGRRMASVQRDRMVDDDDDGRMPHDKACGTNKNPIHQQPQICLRSADRRWATSMLFRVAAATRQFCYRPWLCTKPYISKWAASSKRKQFVTRNVTKLNCLTLSILKFLEVCYQQMNDWLNDWLSDCLNTESWIERKLFDTQSVRWPDFSVLNIERETLLLLPASF